MSLNLRPSQVPVVIKHSPKGSLTLAAAQVRLSIKVYKHKARPAASTQTDRQNRHPAVWTGRCQSLHLLEPTAGKQSWNSGVTEELVHKNRCLKYWLLKDWQGDRLLSWRKI